MKIARWYPNPKDFRARAIILGEQYSHDEKELIAAGIIEARSEKNYPPRAQFATASLTPGITEEEIVTGKPTRGMTPEENWERISAAESPQQKGEEPANLAGDDENTEEKK
ncbi:MAG: hypothetical protein ACYDCD_12960 [Candidatus Acidiferrales bacterium]